MVTLPLTSTAAAVAAPMTTTTPSIPATHRALGCMKPLLFRGVGGPHGSRGPASGSTRLWTGPSVAARPPSRADPPRLQPRLGRRLHVLGDRPRPHRHARDRLRAPPRGHRG